MTDAKAADLIRAERLRRSETQLAILDVVERADPASGFTVAQLRKHLALYYGAELAESATPAELIGGAGCAGACPTAGMLWNARLRKPSRAALRRVAAQWNAQIPSAEIPMIRRPYTKDGAPPVEPEDIPDPGTLVKYQGVVRQQSDPEASQAWRDGGDNRGGYTTRRRRFPSYIARLREFLDRDSSIQSTDREILEFIVEGKTLQWIADEMGMKKPTVHKRVSQLRAKAGIAGPGAGR